MALPALEVRADCEQSTENGQINIITAAAGEPGRSNHSSPWWWHFPFFCFFGFFPPQNQLNEELELLVGHKN